MHCLQTDIDQLIADSNNIESLMSTNGSDFIDDVSVECLLLISVHVYHTTCTPCQKMTKKCAIYMYMLLSTTYDVRVPVFVSQQVDLFIDREVAVVNSYVDYVVDQV